MTKCHTTCPENIQRRHNHWHYLLTSCLKSLNYVTKGDRSEAHETFRFTKIVWMFHEMWWKKSNITEIVTIYHTIFSRNFLKTAQLLWHYLIETCTKEHNTLQMVSQISHTNIEIHNKKLGKFFKIWRKSWMWWQKITQFSLKTIKGKTNNPKLQSGAKRRKAAQSGAKQRLIEQSGTIHRKAEQSSVKRRKATPTRWQNDTQLPEKAYRGDTQTLILLAHDLPQTTKLDAHNTLKSPKWDEKATNWRK